MLPRSVCACASGARCDVRNARCVREHAERDEAGHAHHGERDAPVERRRQREAHDRRQRVAQVAADAVRRIRVAQAPRRDVGVQDREVGRDGTRRCPRPSARRSGTASRRPARATRACVPPASSARPASSTGRAPKRSTAKPATNCVTPLARVEHADQQAEQRPRHVELGAQQREQRRQRELEEVRERVRDADEADDADVAAERLGGGRYPRRHGVKRSVVRRREKDDTIAVRRDAPSRAPRLDEHEDDHGRQSSQDRRRMEGATHAASSSA